MVDAFVRDYLIERVEMALDHRVLTGYYPRLTLAPGQRFASKGGYIVRFSDPQGPRSEEHTSELQSQSNLVCRLLLEKKKTAINAVFEPSNSQRKPVPALHCFSGL